MVAEFIAGKLREQRSVIARHMARQVAGWEKYRDRYAADPAEFADIECGALVDYLARFAETGDENFRHLYIGEKAKQFYDPGVDADERRLREKALLVGERQAVLQALGDDAAPWANAVFDSIEDTMTRDAPFEAKVMLIGDCLHLDVVAFLTAPLLADGIRLRPTFVTPHDAFEQRNALSKLADERFDAIFYSPYTYTFDKDYEALQRPREALNWSAAAKRIAKAGDATAATLDTLADLFDCPLFVHSPAAIFRREPGLRDKVRAAVTAPIRHYAAGKLAQRLRHHAGARNARGGRIHVIHENAVIAPVGLSAAGAFLHKSRLQHPARFGALVAARYRDLIAACVKLAKRKVVVCDLDNTLWEGVIGEGLGVAHHGDRQDILLRLKQRGVVLTIASKNDPDKVVWTGDGCRLCAEDFVSSQISWDPKPISIGRIARHLNLKEKDFVFVDDRADEREMVSERHPGLLVLDALDARSWRLLDLWAEILPANPNADRTDFYKQRDARQSFLAAENETSLAERSALYDQLDLQLDIRNAAAGDLTRVTELINRTNQFNMTGQRITSSQTAAFAVSPDARILVADAADKFGSMGTIAVLIAVRTAGRVEIPFYVLSCRVFGYGMEMAILEQARSLAQPGDALAGPFTETPFNQPCHRVYPDAGFQAAAEGWVLPDASEHPIETASWLRIRAEIPPFAAQPALTTIDC